MSESRFSGKHFFLILALLAFGGLLGSCVTAITLAEVPDNLSPAQLFQKAQDALNSDAYENARVYVMAFKDRYPDDSYKDLEADYLLIQISLKEGNEKGALAAARTLAARYDSADAASYPQWVKILCGKLITRLDSKLNPTPVPTAEPVQTPAPASSATPAASASPTPATTVPSASPSPASQAIITPSASPSH